MRGRPDHVVHLELRTTSLARACSFYTQLFDWRVERIEACGASYLSLDLGPSIEGGVVEQDAGHAVWLPGWRSIVATPAGGEIALWQPKR